MKHGHENDATEPGGFWSGLLAGLLIGGLAGAGSMLLLAPQSGKKTRAKLLRQGHDLREQAVEAVEDKMEQARDETDQITHDVSKQAGKLEQQGKALFDGQKNNFVAMTEAGKNAIQGN